MAYRTDLLLDNNDLSIKNNDLMIVQSDNQHIIDTINACPGWWKQYFTDGVAILSYMKASNSQELQRSTQLQLQSDGYSASPSVSFDSLGNLILNANVTI